MVAIAWWDSHNLLERNLRCRTRTLHGRVRASKSGLRANGRTQTTPTRTSERSIKPSLYWGRTQGSLAFLRRLILQWERERKRESVVEGEWRCNKAGSLALSTTMSVGLGYRLGWGGGAFKRSAGGSLFPLTQKDGPIPLRISWEIWNNILH